MKRREFISLLGGAAAWPLAVTAQQPATVQKIGFLSDESRIWGSAAFKVFAKALDERGYVEGRNIIVVTRYSEGKDELLPGLANELVGMVVNVILAVGTPASRAAKNITNSIPIIFSRIADPIALGLVASLARPGGNLTGVSIITADLAAKRLELLADAIPGIRRVGVLWEPTFPSAPIELRETEHAAQLLNIELERLGVERPEELEVAVRTLVEQQGQALIVVPGPLFSEQRKHIAEIGFTTMTGGGPGIMEAANRGATESGGISVGCNIRLPFEQGANPYITEGLHFEFHYFFMRKFWFAYLAKALVIFPGGFCTCD